MTARVAVVLAVRNGERHVAAALRSVLDQRYRALEIRVVDDGSTDGTPAILRTFRDERMVVLTRPARGLAAALNDAIAGTECDLIARMDADDVALPERLAAQVGALDAAPGLGLLGTACREIDEAGLVLRTFVPPLDDGAIRRRLIRANPFVHASVVFRRAAFHAAGEYDPSFPVAQDYDLWMRMSRATRLGNLAEPLLLRRVTPTMVSRTRARERRRAEVRIRLRELRRGAYPVWCGVYLLRALAATALPSGLGRVGRGAGR
jgi:glycosyltransferase involved in cell wall biosynthesis